jgi:hypothetical protein
LIFDFHPSKLSLTQVKFVKIEFKKNQKPSHFKKRGQKVTLFPAAVLARKQGSQSEIGERRNQAEEAVQTAQ